MRAFRNANPAYPKITFGIRACAATGDKLGTCTNTFDDAPPDNSPGFHSIELPSNSSGADFPMYGYYVGPAATITVKSRGKTVKAHTETWSEDSNVVLFWFPLDQVYLKPNKKSPLFKEGGQRRANSRTPRSGRPARRRHQAPGREAIRDRLTGGPPARGGPPPCVR